MSRRVLVGRVQGQCGRRFPAQEHRVVRKERERAPIVPERRPGESAHQDAPRHAGARHERRGHDGVRRALPPVHVVASARRPMLLEQQADRGQDRRARGPEPDVLPSRVEERGVEAVGLLAMEVGGVEQAWPDPGRPDPPGGLLIAGHRRLSRAPRSNACLHSPAHAAARSSGEASSSARTTDCHRPRASSSIGLVGSVGGLRARIPASRRRDRGRTRRRRPAASRAGCIPRRRSLGRADRHRQGSALEARTARTRARRAPARIRDWCSGSS